MKEYKPYIIAYLLTITASYIVNKRNEVSLNNDKKELLRLQIEVEKRKLKKLENIKKTTNDNE